MFEEAYKSLNSAQKKAVDTIEGPVMVIAGPGTGKTTILTLRIANILKQTDTPPSGILAITFTESGAKAMRTKLKKIIGARAHEVRIHTFHGFASSIISEFQDHFVHIDKFKQLTDIGAESIIRDILKSEKYRPLRPYSNPDFYLSKIMSAISDAKRESYTPEMIEAHAEEEIRKIEEDTESYSTRGKTKGELRADVKKTIEKCERTKVLADLYREYESIKKESKKMDFDDLISELVLALKRDELLLRMVQEKFLYIHIDEHQDTNNIQNELIKILADFFDTPNVFIVGDEKQAIFRFQGASVENFLTFQNIWKDIEVIKLTDNYRSHQSILDASFSMIENNYGDKEFEDLRVRLQSKGSHNLKPIEIIKGADVVSTEDYLIDELKKIPSGKTVAVITKTNKDLERILRLCENNDIKVSSERSVDIFGSPIGNLFFDLISFIDDPSQSELLAKTLAAGMWQLEFDDSIQMIKNLKAGKKIDLEQFKYIQNLSIAPLEYIIEIANVSGLKDLIVRDPISVEVWRGIVELSTYLIRQNDIEDPRILIRELIAYKASSERRSVKVPIGTSDLPISVMTAHGSKGLEFDYVFIPYATEESWIGRVWPIYFSLPQTRSQNEISDIRRLFYVALTRAKEHAVVLYGSENQGEILTPIRFIDELDQDHIVIKSLSKSESKIEKTLSQNKNPNTNLKKSKEKYLDYTKSVLENSGLSVTALNHFLVCPSQFLYLSILKIPQAPAALAEKGTAMHSAFSRIWSLKERSRASIEKTLSETIKYYFEESLLSVFEKESIIKELEKIIPIVSTELEPHFNQPGTAFSESKIESEFKNQKVTIPLRGNLDVIIDNIEEVRVFDYKTKQAMSENEIRGNTKNSNGGYFRQLVFYHYLLQNDIRFHKKEIIPALVFVVPDSGGHCQTMTFNIDKEDTDKLINEIESLIDEVWNGEFMNSYCQEKDCPWCRLKKASLS